MSYENHKRVVYYIFRDGYWGVCKIGTTVCLPKRLGKYKSQNRHVDWVILGLEESEENDYGLEFQRHRQFAKSRISGEWFWVTPDLANHISSLNPQLLEVYLP